VLATLVQNRATTHISTLIQQSRPVSQAAAALLRQQGLNLAIQDAFWLSLLALIPAFLAVCFIPVPKPAAQAEEKMQTSGQTVLLVFSLTGSEKETGSCWHGKKRGRHAHAS
jgi:hypothetical protein